MTDASRATFDTFDSWKSVEDAIEAGEAEGLYLECKSPYGPKINQELRAKIARCVSGYANSAGGVLLFGVATTKHKHSGLDILTQIEPIANVANFEKSVKITAVQAATPTVTAIETRVLKEKDTDTRGLVLLWIGPVAGDPLMSTIDDKFYFRSGDEIVVAPYEVVKRQFAASSMPDLRPIVLGAPTDANEDDRWTVTIAVENFSSAFAQHVEVTIEVNNPEEFKSISVGPPVQDASAFNPGRRVFMASLEKGVHRGKRVLTAELTVVMEKEMYYDRNLGVQVSLYANNMRATQTTYLLRLLKSGFEAKVLDTRFVY